MTQTIKQRVTLRGLRSDLVDVRNFLRTPLPPLPTLPDGTIDITRISLPTDVIAPAPPPVLTSGAALGRARFFLNLWQNLTDALSFFTRKPRRSETGSRNAVSCRERSL